jgi:peptidoglycan/LPS O-acetylase OafA/YrhL
MTMTSERRKQIDPKGLDRGRNSGLDGLRAVACLLVLVFHLRNVNGIEFGPIDRLVLGGSSGVYMFFAISGYLLYKPFLRGPVDLASYGLKRFGRLVPGYFVALAGLTLITGNHRALQHPLPFLTMTASYDIPLRDFLGVAWTLSAEILFYVTLPVISRLARGREVLVLGALAVASMVFAWIHGVSLADPKAWTPGTYPLSFYAFVPGMLLAFVEVKRPSLFGRLGSPLYLVLGVASLVLGCLMTLVPVAFATGLGTPLVMAWLLQRDLPGGRWLGFAGGASYALYLWHRDLLIAFGPIGVAIALVGAAASWALVERPILARIHTLTARRAEAHSQPHAPLAVSTP